MKKQSLIQIIIYLIKYNKANSPKVLEDQKNALINLLKEKKIPFLSINLKKRDETTLGELFSYFIFETIFVGENLKCKSI